MLNHSGDMGEIGFKKLNKLGQLVFYFRFMSRCCSVSPRLCSLVEDIQEKR